MAKEYKTSNVKEWIEHNLTVLQNKEFRRNFHLKLEIGISGSELYFYNKRAWPLEKAEKMLKYLQEFKSELKMDDVFTNIY